MLLPSTRAAAIVHRPPRRMPDIIVRAAMQDRAGQALPLRGRRCCTIVDARELLSRA